MKIRGAAIFVLLFPFFFAGALYLCRDWPVEARLFPSLIAVGGIGLSVWILGAEITYARSPGKTKGTIKKDKPRAVPGVSKPKATPKGEVMMMFWLAAFVGMILVFGFWVAIALFMPLFTFVFGHEKWKTVVIFTVVVWGGMYVIFHFGLRAFLHEGILGLL